MSKEKKRSAKDILEQMIKADIPDLMEQIMAEPKVEADVKAARVGLASTALHHLRLLAAAFE